MGKDQVEVKFGEEGNKREGKSEKEEGDGELQGWWEEAGWCVCCGWGDIESEVVSCVKDGNASKKIPTRSENLWRVFEFVSLLQNA